MRVGTLVQEEEWAVRRAVTLALLPDSAATKSGVARKRFAAISIALPAWMRQEISVDQLKNYYENVTGEALVPLLTDHSFVTRTSRNRSPQYGPQNTRLRSVPAGLEIQKLTLASTIAPVRSVSVVQRGLMSARLREKSRTMISTFFPRCS